jgi:hypothetical protein
MEATMNVRQAVRRYPSTTIWLTIITVLVVIDLIYTMSKH